MQEIQINRLQHLLNTSRVMTLAVSDMGDSWASPVYFVYLHSRFYFFSSPLSRHIRYAADHQVVGAAVFHDSDGMTNIFGLQMSGRIQRIPVKSSFRIIQAYIEKFDFLQTAFGSECRFDADFFLTKFKSRLYGFSPETVLLSDNQAPESRQTPIDLSRIS